MDAVLNFKQEFDGKHLLRCEFSKKQALELIRLLAVKIADSDDPVCLDLLGTIERDSVEDSGNPI